MMMMMMMIKVCKCVCVGGLGSAAGGQETSQATLSTTVHWSKVAAHVVLGECALCVKHWFRTRLATQPPTQANSAWPSINHGFI